VNAVLRLARVKGDELVVRGIPGQVCPDDGDADSFPKGRLAELSARRIR